MSIEEQKIRLASLRNLASNPESRITLKKIASKIVKAEETFDIKTAIEKIRLTPEYKKLLLDSRSLSKDNLRKSLNKLYPDKKLIELILSFSEEVSDMDSEIHLELQKLSHTNGQKVYKLNKRLQERLSKGEDLKTLLGVERREVESGLAEYNKKADAINKKFEAKVENLKSKYSPKHPKFGEAIKNPKVIGLFRKGYKYWDFKIVLNYFKDLEKGLNNIFNLSGMISVKKNKPEIFFRVP